MTPTRNLPRLLARCQAVLSLCDWDATIRFCRPDEVSEGKDAESTINREHMTIDILVVDPALRDTSTDLRPYSLRETVLHELIHLLVRDDDYEREEQNVIKLARALDRVW